MPGKKRSSLHFRVHFHCGHARELFAFVSFIQCSHMNVIVNHRDGKEGRWRPLASAANFLVFGVSLTGDRLLIMSPHCPMNLMMRDQGKIMEPFAPLPDHL